VGQQAAKDGIAIALLGIADQAHDRCAASCTNVVHRDPIRGMTQENVHHGEVPAADDLSEGAPSFISIVTHVAVEIQIRMGQNEVLQRGRCGAIGNKIKKGFQIRMNHVSELRQEISDKIQPQDSDHDKAGLVE